VTIGGGTNSTLSATGTYTQTGGLTTLSAATSKLVVTGATGKVAINGGTLSGIGIVQASGTPGLGVGSGGTLSPGLGGPGTISVTGSFTMNAAGTLAVENNGTAPGQADVVAVSGAATLGGNLAITTGYVPALGDASQIVTAASTSGQFAAVSGADLAGDLSYQVKVNPTNVTLRVVRPTITVADVSVSEGNTGTTNVTFTVQLSEASASTVSVPWQSADGTAVAPGDYTSASGTLTWNHLDPASKTVTVVAKGDNVYENTEAFALNLGTPTNASLGSASATGTITNDDPIPTVSISTDVSPITEGDTGTTPAGFTVTLSNPSAFTITVDYAAQDISATVGQDYQASTGTLTFNPLDVSKAVSVPIIGDTTHESDEQFRVALTGTTGTVTLGTSTATQTITDDDPQVSVGAAGANEGDAGTSTLSMPVSVTPAAVRSGSLTWSTADGTATGGTSCSDPGTDYLAVSSGVQPIALNDTAISLPVTICGDTTYESPDETFTVTLTGAVHAAIGTATATGTIVNDDPVPTVSISTDVSPITEGDTGTTPAGFTVALSNPSASTITVDYAAQDISATVGQDYQASTGTMTFNPLEVSKAVSVPIIGDKVPELDEQFRVALTGTTGTVTLGTATATQAITDNDLPAIAISNATVLEGNTGTKSATFTVSLSGPAPFPVKVSYQTADGTAKAPADYVAVPLTQLTFAPGQTSTTIPVTINGDLVYEQNETFFVNLTSPLNATIADGQGLGTITNNDPVPTISIGDATVNPEGNTGTKNASFTVTLSNPSYQAISVTYATANGTATAPSDYTAVGSPLAFGAGGMLSKTVTVPVIGDTVAEDDETFFVNLTAPVNATITDAQGLGTIVDDDRSADLAVSNTGPASVKAGTNATFQLSVSNLGTATARSVVLRDTLPAGTSFVLATAPGTYNSATRVVTWNLGDIPSGQTVGPLTLRIGVASTQLLGLTDTATVSSASPDPTLGNNSASATTTITPRDIVFVSDRTGSPDIWAMYANGTGQADLTPNSACDVTPAWSWAPVDGIYKVAFASDRNGSTPGVCDGLDNYEIYVVNIDGTGLTRITSNAAVDSQPTWDPEGNFIAFSSNRGTGAFKVWKVDWRTKVMLPALTSACTSVGSTAGCTPDWSALSVNKIAFSSNQGGGGPDYEIYTTNATVGGAATQLTGNTVDDVAPNWSGSTAIAFQRFDGSDFEIARMSQTGTGFSFVTSDPGLDELAAWGPTGGSVVFDSNRTGNTEIWSRALATGVETDLSNNAASDTDPDWRF
jgi:uncharacterized repeat protein (TIGR01451 family)